MESNQETYNIYIGLKDKDILEQKLPTPEFVRLVSGICVNKRVEFSIKNMNGGYITNKGDYILEESLQLTMGGITQSQAIEIAKTLKEILNQECIIVTKEVIKTFLIK